MLPAPTRDLLAYLDRVEPALDRLTHFEMLDIEPTVDADLIQRAYHAVAARMHPDRHRAFLTPQQHERLNVVYGRITDAYHVLRSPHERDGYLRDLAKRSLAGEIGDDDAAADLLSPRAQRLYRRAQAEQRRGDAGSALLNLKMALRLHPDSALLKDALAALQQREQ